MRNSPLPVKKVRTRLNLCALERRDTPAIPAGVGTFVPLWDLYQEGPGYSETHTSGTWFKNAVVVDESGSATTGTFTVDVVGESHATDSGNGSGHGRVTTGTTKSDTTYHLTYQGHNDNGTPVVDSVFYTESGSSWSVLDSTYTASGPFAPPYSSTYHSTLNNNYSVTFNAQQVNGVWSLISFSGTSNTHIHKDSYWNYTFGYSGEEHYDWGHTQTDSLAGSQLVRIVGNMWSNSNGVVNYPGSPNPYTWSNNQNTPFDETRNYLPALPYEMHGWHTEDPNAINFTWHGETSTEGKLNQTVVFDGMNTDVTNFTISGKERDSGYLVEDEPYTYPYGGGIELYHKDELYNGETEWSGYGSRLNGVYVGHYQVDREANFVAHNTMSLLGSYSKGIDYEGYPYEQLFNYTSDRISTGSYSASHTYDDNDQGALVTGSNYNFSDGTARLSHYWGTRDGLPINSYQPYNESYGGSFTFPAQTKRMEWQLPESSGPLGGLPAGWQYCQFVPPTTPPAIPGVPHPGGGLRAGAGLVQGYYNNKIQAIGEDAKKKVGKAIGQEWVMIEMGNEAAANGGKRYSSGTFKYTGKGNTFAQAVGMGKQVDKAVAEVEKNNSVLYDNVKTTVDIEITYSVEPAPGPGQNRSGKVVMEYKWIVNWTGTSKRSGRATGGVGTTLGGNGWFEDDNMKTTDLHARPPK